MVAILGQSTEFEAILSSLVMERVWGLKLFIWVLRVALIKLEDPVLVCRCTINTVRYICIYINIPPKARYWSHTHNSNSGGGLTCRPHNQGRMSWASPAF